MTHTVELRVGNKHSNIIVEQLPHGSSALVNAYKLRCAECAHVFPHPITIAWQDIAQDKSFLDTVMQAVLEAAKDHVLVCAPLPEVEARIVEHATATLIGDEPPRCDLCETGVKHDHPADPGANLTDAAYSV